MGRTLSQDDIHAALTAPVTCSVKGCSRPVYAVALCSPHYRRLRTTGDVWTDVPLRIAKYTKKDKCMECGRGPVYSKRLCKKHYDRSRTGKK